MRMLHAGMLVTCVTMMTACSGRLEPGLPPGAVALQVESFAETIFTSFYSSGPPSRERVVIRDADEWATKWASLTSTISPPPPLPEIDFTSHMVLLAAMGTKPSGGYSIAIASAWEIDGTVTAEVRETSPGAGCGVTLALTAPVTAVRVPRRDGPVEFVERTETHNC